MNISPGMRVDTVKGTPARRTSAWHVAGLVALVFVAACSREPPATGGEQIRPVKYTRVTARDAQRRRVFSGAAEADEQTDISFKVPGTLRERPVQVGDRVAAGDLLGALDSRDFEVAVREAEAQLARALAELRNSQANYERLRALYENDNVSQSELSSARAGAESAQAQVRVARQSLANARLQASYTKINATDACEVARTYVKVNENVASGQPVVQLNCGACPDVRVSVPETRIGAINPGRDASVVFAALGDKQFPAVVDEVGVAVSSESRAFSVVVKVTADCSLIRSGMAADVEFRIGNGDQPEQLEIPWVAVGEDRRGRFVYRLEMIDTTLAIARRQAIETGDITESGVVVTSGLAVGDRIATAGVRRLADGMKVKLYDDAP
jgi:RND family efflux transporter MFP subunit